MTTPDALGEAFGDVAVLLGASPLLGRLLAVLVVAEEPLSLDQLCMALDSAKSTVSVAVRRLAALGLVERVAMVGDRRDYWQGGGDLRGMLAACFQQSLGPVVVALADEESLRGGVAKARLGGALSALRAVEASLAVASDSD